MSGTLPVRANGSVALATVSVFFGSAARLASVNGVAPFSAPSPIAVPWLMVTAVGRTPGSTVVTRTCVGPTEPPPVPAVVELLALALPPVPAVVELLALALPPVPVVLVPAPPVPVPALPPVPVLPVAVPPMLPVLVLTVLVLLLPVLVLTVLVLLLPVLPVLPLLVLPPVLLPVLVVPLLEQAMNDEASKVTRSVDETKGRRWTSSHHELRVAKGRPQVTEPRDVSTTVRRRLGRDRAELALDRPPPGQRRATRAKDAGEAARQGPDDIRATVVLDIRMGSTRLPPARWSSLVARRAHNPKVAGSNPARATKLPAVQGPVRPVVVNGAFHFGERSPSRPRSVFWRVTLFMPDADLLPLLISRLVAATYFDDAAVAVLEVMFGAGGAALAGRGRLLRGVVHLRPEGSYQRLFGLEHGSGTRVEGVSYLTSGNVWCWIEEHRCSVSIDVRRGALRSWMPEGPVDRRDDAGVDGLPGDATRERMLGRDATHVHVVPLRAPGGVVGGMITLEAGCKPGDAEGPAWDACYEELETLAGVAGAFIAARALPGRPAAAPGADEFLPVVGASTTHLIELLRAFAPRDDTISISGPTGAGKSRLARYCHEQSLRSGGRFEVLDVLGVPEDLQLAELFGWKRGAFTGAVKDNPGAVTRAAKGTLFLDEIDKLSLKAQAGLLRFIEERSYRMLGDDAVGERRADVRLLVGTNADLRAAVRAGRFREDLYYRINVLPVRLPPLSERLDELPRWADYMLGRRHREASGEGAARFDPEAVKLLASVPWPGNLRQLDNIVRRAYALLLAGQSGGRGDLVVQRRHVERALTFDVDAEPSAALGLLWRAARSFVQEAERREAGGAPLPLDLCDAFRGMVLGAAVQQRGRDGAFALLGQQPLLKNRNHHRALRRELDRVRDLVQALGGEADPDLTAMLSAEEEAEGR